MRISTFPRPGYPIGPALLAPFLAGTFRISGLPYSDLGASIWSKKKPLECKAIGKSLASKIAARLPAIIAQLGPTMIAPSNGPLSVFDLQLDARTWGVLYHETKTIKNRDLSKFTIEKVIELLNSRPELILDLLTSIEGFVAAGGRANQELLGKDGEALRLATYEVLSERPGLASKFTDVLVPALPPGVQWSDLNGPDRSIAAIKAAGLSEPKTWAKQSIAQIAELEGVGAIPLSELVGSILEAQTRILNSAGLSPEQEVESAKKLIVDIGTQTALRRGMLRRNFPKFPTDATLFDLQIVPRTEGILQRAGIHGLDALGKLTLAQMLAWRGCGPTSIVNLLENQIRLWNIRGIGGSAQQKKSRQEPVRKAELREDIAKILAGLKTDSDALNASNTDPRLGRMIKSISPESADLRALTQLKLKDFPLDRVNQLMVLRDTIAQFKTQTLEEEILDLLVIAPNQDKEQYRVMIARFYGFGETKKMTLQAVGSKTSHSRERVRQVCSPTRMSRFEHRVYAPALDRIIQVIHELAPAAWGKMLLSLKERKLLKDKIPLSTITRFAKLLDREFDLKI